ncbi:hypothetical protein M758_UG206600 [Ceratodon purpureus]|nr:hypothetical protein M758_UG206600 [Ceratodon purpureus]
MRWLFISYTLQFRGVLGYRLSVEYFKCGSLQDLQPRLPDLDTINFDATFHIMPRIIYLPEHTLKLSSVLNFQVSMMHIYSEPCMFECKCYIVFDYCRQFLLVKNCNEGRCSPLTGV